MTDNTPLTDQDQEQHITSTKEEHFQALCNHISTSLDDAEQKALTRWLINLKNKEPPTFYCAVSFVILIHLQDGRFVSDCFYERHRSEYSCVVFHPLNENDRTYISVCDKAQKRANFIKTHYTHCSAEQLKSTDGGVIDDVYVFRHVGVLDDFTKFHYTASTLMKVDRRRLKKTKYEEIKTSNGLGQNFNIDTASIWEKETDAGSVLLLQRKEKEWEDNADCSVSVAPHPFVPPSPYHQQERVEIREHPTGNKNA